jgi:class 3 adenylate cyclase
MQAPDVRYAGSTVTALRDRSLELRAGIHTGECEVGQGRVTGITVHTGARIAANAAPGEVLVSRTVTELVAGSGLGFLDRGIVNLKGVPGDWNLYALNAATV